MSELDHEKWVQVPGIPEFLAKACREKSDVEHFEEAAGSEAAKEATSGADNVPAEEEEEENLNMLKRKRKESSSHIH